MSLSSPSELVRRSPHERRVADYTILVCVDSKGGIGKDGTIPWHNKTFRKEHPEISEIVRNDLLAFKKKTMFGVVILGRKTFDSLPIKNPLVFRMKIVLTMDVDRQSINDDVVYCHSIEDAMNEACIQSERIRATAEFVGHLSSRGDIFVIGGGSIYSQFLEVYPELCVNIDITRIDHDFDCDVFFEEV